MEKEIQVSYREFAWVYDLFMEETPYALWCERIRSILKEYKIEDGLLLDLGCGTGSMTEALSEAGYDMIGVDSSPEMLEEAMDKRAESGRDILYLQQDMRSFELYGTVRAIVSVCDCINYITEKEELLKVFQLVDNYLDPGGLFIFDFNTKEKYKKIGDDTIAENQEGASFIWENFYDEEESLNEYALTLFIEEKDNHKKDYYHKYVEYHRQRAYEVDEMKELLTKAGLSFVAAYDGYTEHPASGASERIVMVCREKKKRG